MNPVHAPYGPAPVEFDPFLKPRQPCTVMYCDFCFRLLQRYVPGEGVIQVCDRTNVSPCPSRLLLSVRVLVCFLKEYEKLHVHFDDCVGRRVTNASGAFLELASSWGSSIAMPSPLTYSSIYTPEYLPTLPVCSFTCIPSRNYFVFYSSSLFFFRRSYFSDGVFFVVLSYPVSSHLICLLWFFSVCFFSLTVTTEFLSL